jgi:hypothetical protein
MSSCWTFDPESCLIAGDRREAFWRQGIIAVKEIAAS